MQLDISRSEISAALRTMKEGGELGRCYCVMIYLSMRLTGSADHEEMLGSMLKVLAEPDQKRVTQALRLTIDDDFAP